MARWDGWEWLGPTVNEGDGDGQPGEPGDRMYEVRGVVLHIAEGSYAGTDSWQHNPDAEVSSHFLHAKDGRRGQVVDTADRAWTQSAGNGHWLSIENEGYHGDSLTPGQIEAAAMVLARAHQVYAVPLQSTDDVNGFGLGWHGMGGAAWGGHYDCPGDPIKAQRPAIIARAQEIATGGELDMATADEIMARLDSLGKDLGNLYEWVRVITSGVIPAGPRMGQPARDTLDGAILPGTRQLANQQAQDTAAILNAIKRAGVDPVAIAQALAPLMDYGKLAATLAPAVRQAEHDAAQGAADATRP